MVFTSLLVLIAVGKNLFSFLSNIIWISKNITHNTYWIKHNTIVNTLTQNNYKIVLTWVHINQIQFKSVRLITLFDWNTYHRVFQLRSNYHIKNIQWIWKYTLNMLKWRQKLYLRVLKQTYFNLSKYIIK